MKPAPVQLADYLTPHLVRRFQAGREISPLYIAGAHEAGIDGNACDEAARAGLRSVTVGERTYVRFGSEWYSWHLPEEEHVVPGRRAELAKKR